jgi:hypothetical protein
MSTDTSVWQRLAASMPKPKLALLVAGVIIAVAAVAYVYALDRFAMPLPPTSDGSIDAGQRYCSSLTESSSKIAFVHLVCGWVLTVAVVITAAIAMVKVTAAEDRLVWVACIAVAGYLGRAVLQRADAATELAVAATTAQTLDHADGDPTGASLGKVVFNTCAQAWGAWLKSRGDTTAIARAALEESIKGIKQANDTASSTAQVQATQAKQAAQTVSGVAAQTDDDVSQKAAQLEKLADSLSPAQRDQVKALSSEIKSTVANVASVARSATVTLGGYVVVMVTDSSTKTACEEIKRRAGDNPTLKLFLNGAHTRWIVALGPVPSVEEARALKAQSKNLPPDAYVTQMAPDWSPVSCGE